MGDGLPLAPIDRLIRNSGAERVSEDASQAMAKIIADFVEDISGQALKLAKHAGRKTITSDDILLAAKEF
jgi:histone H3/H4